MNGYIFCLIALFIICVAIIIYRIIEGDEKSCCHAWETLNTGQISVSTTYGDKITQSTEIKSCKLCGHLIRINLTTGESEVLSHGGTPHNQTKLV